MIIKHKETGEILFQGAEEFLKDHCLTGADLSGLTLWGLDFSGCYLARANLNDTTIERCNFSNAFLNNATINRAQIRNTQMDDAELRGAQICDTEIYHCSLVEANLAVSKVHNSRIFNTGFRGAVLMGMGLEGTTLPPFQICPQEGSFIGYKKVHTGVIKLLIPAEARRTSSLIGRKCRAEFVKVLEGTGCSNRGGIYKAGEFTYPDSYDDDIRVECTHGIHFFMTEQEAEDW